MTPDICLVLEGTYPFVHGGVSSWVHLLVNRLDHLRFRIVHISPHRGFYEDGPVFDMPSNVVELEEVFLHEYSLAGERLKPSSRKRVERFAHWATCLAAGDASGFPDLARGLDDSSAAELAADLLQTPESWKVLVDAYRAHASHESFLDYFWTWRYTHMPVVTVLAARTPPARLYHAVSTGYAGALASAANVRTGAPMLLTEHGIYAKERRIEINRAARIRDWESNEVVAERLAPFFKRFWRRHFATLSRVTYRHSERIITLFEGNREAQIADGAHPSKIEIIPNGVDLSRFAEPARLLDARGPRDEFVVGLVGRVCPIKDIKTFIYSMSVLTDRLPHARGRILGPVAEDPEYVAECRELIQGLGLGDRVTIEGRVDVARAYPELDAVVLTSISEGQPLVVLEAGAVGLPIVATDVGACSELLRGRTSEDRRLGPGGIVTPIATPGATADALLRLAADPGRRQRMGAVMRQRVHRYYDLDDMVEAYAQLYEGMLRRREVA